MTVAQMVELAESALQAFESYREKTSPAPPVLRRSVWIAEESASGVSYSQRVVDEPQWPIIQAVFVDDQFSKTEIFQQSVDCLVAAFSPNLVKLRSVDDPRQAAADLLARFVKRIMLQSSSSRASSSDLQEIAILFRTELQLAPINYRLSQYMKGLHLRVDSVTLTPDVTLRKPTVQHVNDILQTFEYSFLGSFLHFPDPSAILEGSFVGQNEKEGTETLQRLLDALRLYRVGSVDVTHSMFVCNSVLHNTGPRCSFKNVTELFKYDITDQDVQSLQRTIPKLMDDLAYTPSDKAFRSLEISHQRYRWTLLERANWSLRLMTAIMGLEALLTTDRDRGENAFRLSHRTASLLSIAGFDPLKVKPDIQKAYTIRNSYAHGSYDSAGEHKASELGLEVINYLRACLIIMLRLLRNGQNKNDVVNLIDDSFVSAEKSAKCAELVRQAVDPIAEIVRPA